MKTWCRRIKLASRLFTGLFRARFTLSEQRSWKTKRKRMSVSQRTLNLQKKLSKKQRQLERQKNRSERIEHYEALQSRLSAAKTEISSFADRDPARLEKMQAGIK